MKRSLFAVLLSFIMLLGTMAWATAEGDSVERLQKSADVLKEIMAAPDKGIPEEVLDNAKCIMVVPNLIKAGFIVGGKHGRGVASCLRLRKRKRERSNRLRCGSWQRRGRVCRPR